MHAIIFISLSRSDKVDHSNPVNKISLPTGGWNQKGRRGMIVLRRDLRKESCRNNEMQAEAERWRSNVLAFEDNLVMHIS